MSNEKIRAEAFAACPDGIDWGAFWLGYKASRAALCVELPKEDTNIEYHGYVSLQDTVDAIESTGVRTK